MKKIAALTLFFVFCSIQVFAQLRRFDDIFPDIDKAVKEAAFSETGFLESSQAASGFEIIGRNSNIDPQIVDIVITSKPLFLAESLLVIPSKQDISLLDIYNALGSIRGLKGRLYDSATRNQAIPLFEDAVRIAGERQIFTTIPDPPPASLVPDRETVYIRLRDANFGNTFFRGEINSRQNSLSYNLTNIRTMTFLLLPVIKEGRFFAQLYIEPIVEGVLIYSLAGADVSDFISSRIHMESAISKRLEVIIFWAADGIVGKN